MELWDLFEADGGIGDMLFTDPNAGTIPELVQGIGEAEIASFPGAGGYIGDGIAWPQFIEGYAASSGGVPWDGGLLPGEPPTGGGFNYTTDGTPYPVGAGGDVGIGEPLYSWGHAAELGEGMTSGQMGTPADWTRGTVGGAFGSIGQQQSGLWQGLGKLINPVATALTGRALIGDPRAAATAQLRQQQLIQNILVVTAIGAGAYLLFKRG